MDKEVEARQEATKEEGMEGLEICAQVLFLMKRI